MPKHNPSYISEQTQLGIQHIQEFSKGIADNRGLIHLVVIENDLTILNTEEITRGVKSKGEHL